ncbi:MAG TPA: hypothetical protein PKE03_10115 [Bacteroidales bacterium]|nr:hypothetical protein [Bacteroidales bacterium]
MNMNLKDYYAFLRNSHNIFIAEVQQRLGINRKTFYNRLKHDSWSDSDREAIRMIAEELGKKFQP